MGPAKAGLATKHMSFATSFQASSSKTRVIGENKLLSSKKKYNPYSRKCIDCKVTVQQNQATRCQACAYKKGELRAFSCLVCRMLTPLTL